MGLPASKTDAFLDSMPLKMGVKIVQLIANRAPSAVPTSQTALFATFASQVLV